MHGSLHVPRIAEATLHPTCYNLGTGTHLHQGAWRAASAQAAMSRRRSSGAPPGQGAMVRADERRGFNLLETLVLLLAGALLTCYVESAPGAGDLRRRPAGENSKLHVAVKSGNRVEVERLLDEGADVEAKPFDMYSAPPLHFAAFAGDLQLVRLLLDRGASVDSKELRHGSTALHVASSRGHTEIVRHLLQRGAQVNAKNTERGHTPLHEASRGGELFLVSAC